MSNLVQKQNAETFEAVYEGGYDKKYPREDLVRLYHWYFNGTPGYTIDYGCGPGSNGFALLESGCQMVFADVSRTALKRVAEKLDARPDLKNHARIEQIALDADKLNHPNDSFDYVVCLSVLSNLATEERILKMLTEFSRILKPGGKMIVDINGPDSTYVHDGTRVDENVFETAPRRGFDSDPVRMYFSQTKEQFAKLVDSAPGIVVDDVGFSSFAYQDHDSYEFIVCAHKPGSEKEGKTA